MTLMTRIYSHIHIPASAWPLDVFAAAYRPLYALLMPAHSTRLRQLRKQLNLKQGQLAAALGVTQGTVSRWETGEIEPDLSVMLKVADIAKIDSREFIYHQQHIYKTGRFLKFIEVVAAVCEDQWLPDPFWHNEDKIEVTIPSLPSWDGVTIRGYYVDDKACEPQFAKGSVIFAGSWTNRSIKPADQEYVILQRTNEAGLSELTVRKYMQLHRSVAFLLPLSEVNPIGQKYFVSLEGPATEQAEVLGLEAVELDAIKGIVIASFAVQPMGSLAGR